MFITHDLGVVAEMADEVIIMYLGKAVEKGPVEEIFDNPKHPYARALLESLPRMEQNREWLRTIRGGIPSPYTQLSGCPFHPRCTDFMPDKCDQVVSHPIKFGGNRKVLVPFTRRNGGWTMREFNTFGLVYPEMHYHLDHRDVKTEIYHKIEQGRYFTLNAARQMGKTTILKEIVGEIESGEDYFGLYIDFIIDEFEAVGTEVLLPILSLFRGMYSHRIDPNRIASKVLSWSVCAPLLLCSKAHSPHLILQINIRFITSRWMKSRIYLSKAIYC